MDETIEGQPRQRIICWSLVILLLTMFTLAWFDLAHAQQSAKVPRVGFLIVGSQSSLSTNIEAFRQGLRNLGYVEGKNIVIEYRHAEGKSDRLPDLARELVRLKVAVIVTASTAGVRAAKQATATIPIVVGSAGDLVREGLVANLARPGGNITGSIAVSPDLSGKRLELLKEVVPKASRMAVIWHPSPWDQEEVREAEIAALTLGVKLQSLQVRSADEFQGAYAAMKKERANALIIIQGSFTGFHRKQLVELAAKNRLPSMCDAPNWTEGGCLMSYGPNRADLYRRAAVYVDKILKGAKPADLPVEQPTKFEFIINLKTAKQIGLTIPPNVLARVDRVIR
jgi:putative ABC transport system substrate-binding protein